MSTTLNELVRDQILADGPQMPDALSQRAHNELCDGYVDAQLNMMTNTELLERISDALRAPAMQRPWL